MKQMLFFHFTTVMKKLKSGIHITPLLHNDISWHFSSSWNDCKRPLSGPAFVFLSLSALTADELPTDLRSKSSRDHVCLLNRYCDDQVSDKKKKKKNTWQILLFLTPWIMHVHYWFGKCAFVVVWWKRTVMTAISWLQTRLLRPKKKKKKD